MRKNQKSKIKNQNSQSKIQNCLLLVLIFLLSCCYAEAAQSVSSKELLEDPDKYDGKTVTFEGEAIGDIMLQGETAWINVRDESGALGIFCTQDLTEQIKYLGSYRCIGDKISVRGTFHHHCSQHGGDTDIHAERISVIEQGKKIPRPLEPQKVKLSIIFPLIAFVLAIVYWIVRRFR